MINANWMVIQASADRKALRDQFGFSAEAERALSHQEVVKELKARKYCWKSQPKRNGHGCP